MTYDLAVIGGGIVGAAVAHRAASTGASVIVFDRADEGRATSAGAGIVGPGLNTRDGAAQLELATAAARAYPSIVDEIVAHADGNDGDNGDTGYDRVGLMAVAIGDHGAELFAAAERTVMDRHRREGHPTGHQISVLGPDEARSHHPALGDVRAALLDTGAARVDGRRMAAALMAAARRHGAEVRHEPVLCVADAQTAAGTVVIAGGAWSPAFGEELEVALPVQPQRGQIAHLQVPAALGDTANWPMLSLLTDQYQVAWPGGRVAVGATRETGSGFAPRTTVDGVRSVLDNAVRATPALAEAELLEIRVGLRPVTPDLTPIIDRLPVAGNVVVATGHGPTGLTTGPFSGRLAADLALGRDVEHDLSGLSLQRDFNAAR